MRDLKFYGLNPVTTDARARQRRNSAVLPSSRPLATGRPLRVGRTMQRPIADVDYLTIDGDASRQNLRGLGEMLGC